MFSAISLMSTCIKNNSGPSTYPSGTPVEMDFIEEGKDLRVLFVFYVLGSYLCIEAINP